MRNIMSERWQLFGGYQHVSRSEGPKAPDPQTALWLYLQLADQTLREVFV